LNKLFTLTSIFFLLSCSTEPSEYEKCYEANLDTLKNTSKGDNLGIIFDVEIEEYINYRKLYMLTTENPEPKNWCGLYDFIDETKCSNLTVDEVFNEYGKDFYKESKDFYESDMIIKDTKDLLAQNAQPDIAELAHIKAETKILESVMNDTLATNAKLICHNQGIY